MLAHGPKRRNPRPRYCISLIVTTARARLAGAAGRDWEFVGTAQLPSDGHEDRSSKPRPWAGRYSMTATNKVEAGSSTNVFLHFYELEGSGFDGDGEYPEQETTGNRGYFGNRESVAESWQRRKTDPLADSISLELQQFAHNPALGRS
jgi:hypothetical protein